MVTDGKYRGFTQNLLKGSKAMKEDRILTQQRENSIQFQRKILFR